MDETPVKVIKCQGDHITMENIVFNYSNIKDIVWKYVSKLDIFCIYPDITKFLSTCIYVILRL